MMRRFFLKVALLITLLFCAVLYGMDLAKQGMMKMEGVEKQHQSSSILDFDIPGLGTQPKTPTAKADQPSLSQSASSNKAVPKQDDIETRLTKLDNIHDFNPYSAMGDKLSDGVSAAFQHGISTTASVFNRIISAIF